MTSKPRSALRAAQCLLLLAVAGCSEEPVQRSADGVRAPFDPPVTPSELPDAVPDDPVQIVEGDTERTTAPGTDAEVFITLGGHSASAGVEVAGYVADRVEAGGTCVLTLTEGQRTVRASASALPDARTTVCSLTVPSEQLAAGTWEAVLSYRSPHAAGSSDPLLVEVP